MDLDSEIFEFQPHQRVQTIQYYDGGLTNPVAINRDMIPKESIEWAMNAGYKGKSIFVEAQRHTEEKLAARAAKAAAMAAARNAPPVATPPPAPLPVPPSEPQALEFVWPPPRPEHEMPPTAPAPAAEPPERPPMVEVMFELDDAGQFTGFYTEVIVDEPAGFMVLVRDLRDERGSSFWPTSIPEGKDLALAAKNGDTGYLVRPTNADFTYDYTRYMVLEIRVACQLNE